MYLIGRNDYFDQSHAYDLLSADLWIATWLYIVCVHYAIHISILSIYWGDKCRVQVVFCFKQISSVGLMLGQRRRRWPSIYSPLDQRLLFAGLAVIQEHSATWKIAQNPRFIFCVKMRQPVAHHMLALDVFRCVGNMTILMSDR